MTREEFNARVLPLGDKLFRFATRMLQDRDMTQDALQDVMVKLWNMRKKLDEYRSIEALAMKMTKNRCLDIMKTDKAKYHVDVQDNVQSDETPYSKIAAADSVGKVKEIINSLPPQQRMIIQLRDIEGYSFDEMEEILELSINNIRVNLSRARQKVKEQFIEIHNYGLE